MFTKWELTHSNQLHQLLVTVSKHFLIPKDGNLKYQEKPLDINITNLHKSRKGHLVYFVLRDAFSGTFVFEIVSSSPSLPSLADFLFRAWRKDTGKYLWGLPDYLSIPRSIASPQLINGLEKLGVPCFHPSSGFTSGVGVLRNIEDNLTFLTGRIVDHRPENINRHHKHKIYEYILHLLHGDSNKFKVWQANLPAGHLVQVPDREEFMSCFQDTEQPVAGVIWVKKDSDMEGDKTSLEIESRKAEKKSEEWPPVSEERLEQADALICEAEETTNRDKSLNLARKALKLSPYCVDAYNFLAQESRDTREQLELYERAIQAGKLLLGETFFQENKGHFWGLIETRPYMRAIHGYAETLWEVGRRAEAISNYWEMLRLNPNDNQGIRYVLASCILEEGRDDEMLRLMARHGDEVTGFMAYSKALWTFRTTGGSNDRSDAVLKEAINTNDHVPAYLLGLKFVPYRLPDYYSWGSDEEAIIYAAGAEKAWEKTPGALEWLAHNSIKA